MTLIVIYVASVLLSRGICREAVRRIGKDNTFSYKFWLLWFVPGLNLIAVSVDWLESLTYEQLEGEGRNWFNGKYW